MNVILVDDHAVVREGYRRLLELEPDCQVVGEFSDAESVQTWFARTVDPRVDVLILDLSMPGRSGLDLLIHLVQRFPALRILLFSMHDTPALVQQALKAGAAGFVTKNSAPSELIQAARRVASGARGVLSPDLALLLGQTPEAPHEALSAREFQVLVRLLAGDELESIAQRLHLSSKTVANYQTLIRQKLGVSTAVELLRYGQQHRLVEW